MNDLETKELVSPAGQMALQLRDGIRNGRYALGGALPTEQELCDQFKLSRWSVRKALQVLEREHLIVRQQGRGSFVVSSLGAKGPATLKTGLIGLMVWEVAYGFEGLVQGTCNAAASHGYAVTTGAVQELEDETQSVRAFIRNGVLGALVAPRSPSASRYYDEMIGENIAIVLVDTLIPGCYEDSVLVDNAYGTSIATSHLIDLGHRRIAYLGHNMDLDPPIRGERRRGYLETCRRAGLDVPAEYIMELHHAAYHDPVRTLLRHPSRPTAIVAYNDNWAIKVIQVARELGLRVPQDLSVVGFDDSTFAPGYDVPLTTINPERYDMGVTAMELLIDKIERKKSRAGRSILIAPRLVTRRSSCAPRE